MEKEGRGRLLPKPLSQINDSSRVEDIFLKTIPFTERERERAPRPSLHEQIAKCDMEIKTFPHNGGARLRHRLRRQFFFFFLFQQARLNTFKTVVNSRKSRIPGKCKLSCLEFKLPW